MKGARGLLISITGGRDLTLYELDEAATRIREEVDQDANIILGATFDESMEGTIRVSVVATGIEPPVAEVPITATEQRIAEVAERLRAEARARAVGTPTVTTQPVQYVQQTTRVPEISSAAKAAEIVAQAAAFESPAAPVAHDDVTLTPAQPKAATFEAHEAVESMPVEHSAPSVAYVPPAPDRVMRPARMPRVEELPVPGQKQLRAARGDDGVSQEKKSLLQRLATVGFGRREDAPAVYDAPAPLPVPLPAPVAAPHPAPVAPEPVRPAATSHADYAKRPAAPAYRPAQGNLDAQGRVTPAAPRSAEDDQLEIPAFLRRQSN
jgi:cell division protein FtsZ